MYGALLLMLLLLPTVGWAVDGDCAASYSSGAYHVVECKVCDGDHSATDCMELDLHRATPAGLPSHLVLELASYVGCSDPLMTVNVRGLAEPLGVPFVYATLSPTVTSAVRVEPTRHRYLDADVDAAHSADCADLEVIVRLFYPRVP